MQQPDEQNPTNGGNGKRGRGQPQKYTDKDSFEAAVNAYFKECDSTTIIKQVVQKGEIISVPTPKPYTMAGLARALEIDRKTLNNYKEDDNFFPIISRARERIHEQNVTLALLGCHDSRIAALNLASNYGYAIRTETEVSGTLKLPSMDADERLALQDIARAMARQVVQGREPKQLTEGKTEED